MEINYQIYPNKKSLSLKKTQDFLNFKTIEYEKNIRVY